MNPPGPTLPPSSTPGLFREKALAKLSSPEHLDELVRVVPSLGWLSLLAVLLIIAGALLWGFIGSVPTTVSGQGILLRGGKISAITAQGTGQLGTLSVKVGDQVTVGQKIGTILQPTLLSRIENQKRTVENRTRRLETVRQETRKALQSQTEGLAEQKISLTASIADHQEQLKSLEKVVAAQQKLLVDGLIPMTTLLQSQTQLNSTQLNILSAKSQLQQLETTRLSGENTARQNVYAAETELLAETQSLEEMQVEMAQSSAIVSMLEGRVVGIAAAPGQDISPGTRVVDLEENGVEMTALLYFPAGQGKKVLPGMTAQISPATTPVDKFGFILGKVTDVADVPATPGAMMAVLANQTLIDSITAGGPPLQIDSTLEIDPATVSGFRWSSSHGPALTIPAGTLCTARVIVEEEKPIELVIPLLKKFFGIVD